LKPTLKNPFTLILWIFSSEKFVPDEKTTVVSRSRFSDSGFWSWLFAPESKGFQEEAPMDPAESMYGKGGFWRWLFASEEFVEEPEMPGPKPRFGGQSFWSWLLAPEGSPADDTDNGNDTDN
jgi:hypothetical protein